MEKTKNMFLTSAKELKTTSTLAVCAMLAALALILNSVASINIGPYVKIGFSGIPNQIADYLFGPITACLFAGVLDTVKFFIRPDGLGLSRQAPPRPWPCLRRQRRALQGQGPGFRTHLRALHRAGDAGGGAF